MTITEMIDAVRPFKPCSPNQIRRYLRRLKINPIGCRQSPQPYPNDAAKKILAHLGICPVPAPIGANGHDPETDGKSGRVVSLRKLQSTRAKAKGVGK